jgi:tRNA1Val (adenine37-N6)-methyltransferase
MSSVFRFKQFCIEQDLCAMKVGTDGVLLGAWAEGGRQVLDIGCGTGVVSLMMAQRCPEATVTAIDIMADCCRQASGNAAKSPWGDRIKVENMSLQDFTRRAEEGCAEGESRCLFDSIVSNPPFYEASLKNPDKARATARHNDSLPFGVLSKCVSVLLAPDGVFSVVMAEECCREFIDEAWFAGLYLADTVKVFTKRGKPAKRRLMRFSRVRTAVPVETEAVLLNGDGSRSDWFKALTSDFYL